MIRVNVTGCSNIRRSLGSENSGSGSPSAIFAAVPPSIPRICSSERPAARAVLRAIMSAVGCWPYGKSEAKSACSGEKRRYTSSRSTGLHTDVS